jgi:hypothetical protein
MFSRGVIDFLFEIAGSIEGNSAGGSAVVRIFAAIRKITVPESL